MAVSRKSRDGGVGRARGPHPGAKQHERGSKSITSTQPLGCTQTRARHCRLRPSAHTRKSPCFAEAIRALRDPYSGWQRRS
eukprot:scaffold10520_cov122-Isochrysis_galbana.AAC.5